MLLSRNNSTFFTGGGVSLIFPELEIASQARTSGQGGEILEIFPELEIASQARTFGGTTFVTVLGFSGGDVMLLLNSILSPIFSSKKTLSAFCISDWTVTPGGLELFFFILQGDPVVPWARKSTCLLLSISMSPPSRILTTLGTLGQVRSSKQSTCSWGGTKKNLSFCSFGPLMQATSNLSLVGGARPVLSLSGIEGGGIDGALPSLR